MTYLKDTRALPSYEEKGGCLMGRVLVGTARVALFWKGVGGPVRPPGIHGHTFR